MPVRAIQARIDCPRDVLDHLWRTHVIFNQRLPQLISILFKMRRGECGDTEEEHQLYANIAQFILARGARDGPYLLNAISIKGWQANTARKMKAEVPGPDGRPLEVSGALWADGAERLSAEGQLLYDKRALLGDLPDTLRQMVARECVAIISGHQELLKIWESEHEDWLRRKQEWETDPENMLYLALRPRFEEFEQSVGGKAGKRRERWHRYLDWLKSNPALAAWRGGEPGVVELSAAAKEKIRKARARKVRSIEAEEFWKANPELSALDKLHGYYEREFVRRRKTKKHPDGFDHRPTFTLPDPIRHPRWFVFNSPQTSPQGYRNLEVPAKAGAMGTIQLRLLTGPKSGEEYPIEWVPQRFKSDPRLADFRAVSIRRMIRKGKDKGQEKKADAFSFLDRQLTLGRPAKISGAKLMFRRIKLDADGNLISADPYLVFTCDIEALPFTEAARAVKWTDTGEKRKKVVVPDGLTTCAVDLGIRHIGFATLAVKEAEAVRVLRSRNIWIAHEEEKGRHPGRWSPGPELGHISAHKRELRHLRSERGKPVLGEDSHIELQRHITDMASDRFKKAAREIVNFALNVEGKVSASTGTLFPRADVLIVENLANLLPDAERERGINRALVEFNRGHLVDRIKEVADDCGLRVIFVSPVGTSQVCSRCGALGRRYSIRKGQDGEADIHFGFVESLFACSQCGYRANSDHNASVNLNRRFVFGESAIASFRVWQQLSTKGRLQRLQDIEASLIDTLRAEHRLNVALMPF
jgi:hypothetical protein